MATKQSEPSQNGHRPGVDERQDRMPVLNVSNDVVVATTSASLSFGLVGAALAGPAGAVVGMVAGAAAAGALRHYRARHSTQAPA